VEGGMLQSQTILDAVEKSGSEHDTWRNEARTKLLNSIPVSA